MNPTNNACYMTIAGFSVPDPPGSLFTVFLGPNFIMKKCKNSEKCRVADPGCLSRIPDPDFYPSRIPDPKTATKERGEKKFVVITFYVATNFTKLQIILVLKC
jgi:hypothetical protein